MHLLMAIAWDTEQTYVKRIQLNGLRVQQEQNLNLVLFVEQKKARRWQDGQTR